MAPSVANGGTSSPASTAASWLGRSVLNVSLSEMGMTTSFTSGLPRRDTWTQRPVLTGMAPLFSSNTRTFCRLAVAQTAMTGWSLLWTTSAIGTSMAIEWTFLPMVAFTPARSGSGIRCAGLNGRRPPRSKMVPRSTANASSRWPANVFMLPRVTTASAARLG